MVATSSKTIITSYNTNIYIFCLLRDSGAEPEFHVKGAVLHGEITVDKYVCEQHNRKLIFLKKIGLTKIM